VERVIPSGSRKFGFGLGYHFLIQYELKKADLKAIVAVSDTTMLNRDISWSTKNIRFYSSFFIKKVISILCSR
jgi:hypothetical protein